MTAPDANDLKVLIFGGTTEGRELASALTDLGYAVTVSVATEQGRKELAHIPDIQVVVGRKNREEIAAVLWTGGYTHCVDATHPYATEVSQNIQEACKKVQVKYERLIREEETVELPKNAVVVQTAGEACNYLLLHMKAEDTVFLTTGAKEAADFSDIFPERRYIRVLPTEESRELCSDAGFLANHIFTGHGPFSEQENVQALKQTNATYLVTKDGGKSGGFPEKIAAAVQCHVIPLIIQRPKEEGWTLSQMVEQYTRMMEMLE